MQFSMDSSIFKDCSYFFNYFGNMMPFEFTGSEDEYLACRHTAWLGVVLNCTPILDIWGPDAVAFLNKTCVNRDFGEMKPGMSKHALICNEKGQLLADGVMMALEGGVFRSYWLAPLIQYYILKSGMDVQCEYKQDEYFFQIDGPKSLEILEEACECDLHDIKFAHNRKVKICGTDMTVHRLGMSGALAYEVHGAAADAEIAYTRIREVLLKFGGKLQGLKNYGILNHTPGGYPNQLQHYCYPYYSSGDAGLAEFAKKYIIAPPVNGSAADEPEMYYVTPYELGWGHCINFNHDFMGKEALLAAKNTGRKCVTLEWDPDDVAEVFKSQFLGTDVQPYDAIHFTAQMSDPSEGYFTRADRVLDGEKTVGIASGKTYAFYERKMISLAFIEPQYAVEGTELAVLWGQPDGPQKKIRATVARFPYYQGEYRNETFDTEKIPHRY